jgi:LysR family glycine cleavage system transcriptional activator
MNKILFIHDRSKSMDSKYQRLPLTALRTFEAAARLQSFKQAAEELHVTPTTVSNQIRQLERDWQCQLFVRKTRQLLLTEAGRSLARVVSKAFDDMKREIETRVGPISKSVTLAVGPIFGSRWMSPRLERFRRQHPAIHLELRHGPRISGADSLDTAIAVDWGHGSWNGLEATHLFDIVYAPVVSPELVAAVGDLGKPSDLARYPILHQFDYGEWSAWLELAGVPELEFDEETIIVDSNLVLQAAIDGQGVALGVFPFIQREIDTGRLLRPFDLYLKPSRSFYLLTRPGARSSLEIDTACRWLLSEAAAYVRDSIEL